MQRHVQELADSLADHECAIFLQVYQYRIHPGGFIGVHKHPTSDDTNFVLSGTGVATCDGAEELLQPGACHICPKGSEHSIANTGEDDLVILTVAAER